MRAAEVKKGNVVEHNGTVYQIRDIERSAAQGRSGNVTFRFIMYSVPGGNKFDLSLRAEDEIAEVELVRREANFSYMDGEAFVFLDARATRPTTRRNVVGELAASSAKASRAATYRSSTTRRCVLMPASVVLQVVDTPPELRAAPPPIGRSRRAQHGIEIQVPGTSNGEKIWVNTTTGEFAGRV